LVHEGREFKLHSERNLFKNFHCNFSHLLLLQNFFPSKAEREASIDRISQFHDPSLRKNPHFYKKFFWQGKNGFDCSPTPTLSLNPKKKTQEALERERERNESNRKQGVCHTIALPGIYIKKDLKANMERIMETQIFHHTKI
jgi:hypothetical protein